MGPRKAASKRTDARVAQGNRGDSSSHPLWPGGPDRGSVSLGGQCRISIGNNKTISCEVVGFRDGRALVLPLGSLDGITLGARADFEDRPACIFPSTAWLGRVIDGF